MGTSSSYGGPKGKNPLLPKDFEDNDKNNDKNTSDSQNDAEIDLPNINDNTERWRTVKTLSSKLAKGSVKNYRKVLSSYVKAYGGNKRAASSAKAGKTTAIKLGGFLSGISQQGVQKTFNKYGIEYEGKTVEEVLSAIVNKIAPSGNTKEEAVARNAIIDVIDALYDEIENSDGDLNILENLDDNSFNNLMQKYISSYIFQRFLNDLESRFEEYSKSTESALSLEKEIKEYISGIVDNKLKEQNFSKIDYSSDSVIQTINKIYADCYDVIEGAL